MASANCSPVLRYRPPLLQRPVLHPGADSSGLDGPPLTSASARTAMALSAQPQQQQPGVCASMHWRHSPDTLRDCSPAWPEAHAAARWHCAHASLPLVVPAAPALPTVASYPAQEQRPLLDQLRSELQEAIAEEATLAKAVAIKRSLAASHAAQIEALRRSTEALRLDLTGEEHGCAAANNLDELLGEEMILYGKGIAINPDVNPGCVHANRVPAPRNEQTGK